MADERTEKQKVQEITDKLEKGLKELFESEKYKTSNPGTVRIRERTLSYLSLRRKISRSISALCISSSSM